MVEDRPGPRPGRAGAPSAFSAAARTVFAADYDPPAVVKKWMCRPVWEEFVRLDAFEVQIDTSVDIRVVTDDGAVVGSKTTVGRALIENVLDYADGRLHTVQLPIMNTRSGELVGVLHVRLRVAALNDDIIAANKDRNPNVSLLTAPKTYTKQFALSAADVLSSGASGVAGAMRAGLDGALSAVPIPKKYTAAAAKSDARRLWPRDDLVDAAVVAAIDALRPCAVAFSDASWNSSSSPTLLAPP